MHLIAMIEVLAQILLISHAFKMNKPALWIVILLIPVVGPLMYVISEANGATAEESEKTAADTGTRNNAKSYNVCYIAQGKLFQKNDAATVQQIQSDFGQKMVDQAVKIQQRNEWKSKRTGAFLSGSALWGANPIQGDAIKIAITGAAQGLRNTLYYLLQSDAVGGLFSYDCSTKEEKRLFHRNNFMARDLDFNPETMELLCSQGFPNETASIVIIKPDTAGVIALTEGDAIDEAPSWIPGRERRVLFQSAGVARSQEGYAVGRGPSSIQALDLDNNRLTTVLEDKRYDYLQPHISPDGYFYYIRRPYESDTYKPLNLVLDAVLFPFRLLRALFHFLNFFSLVYSRKPLTTASGPMVKGDDFKNIMLRGRIIDAEKALRSGQRLMGVPSLVPSSWQLIRRSQDNQEVVVARHVAAFDISTDGKIVYSNGCGVFTLNNHNRPELLAKAHLIQDVQVG